MKFSLPFTDYLPPVLDYSDVLSVTDTASFRPDSEQIRAFRVNPAGSSPGTPVYDYPDGKVPKDDHVGPEIVALRSGRLDKADVDALKRNIIQNARSAQDAKHADSVVQAMDKVLGIGQSESSE